MRQAENRINTLNSEKDTLIHQFLGWLHRTAGNSKAMLELGAKDNFAQELGLILNNPIDTMYNTKQSIDKTLIGCVNGLVTAYLKSKTDVVHKAVLVDGNINTLYYLISLKEDSLENRIVVNEFFEFYDDNSFSIHYPVYFQYVADKYMTSIKFKQEIV
jgi:hypothetical protein